MPRSVMPGNPSELENSDDLQPGPSFPPRESEVTAKQLVEAQRENQKRRCTSRAGRGSSTRTSLWSTLAAKRHADDHAGMYKFQCTVCPHIGPVNKTLSTSNVIQHYKTRHETLCRELIALNQQGTPPSVLEERISGARAALSRRRRNRSMDQYFRPTLAASLPQKENNVLLPVKKVHAVAVILFACYTESPCSQLSSPILQGLVDVFGGRILFASTTFIDKMLYETYAAVCRLLRSAVNNAKTGCITVDGWSAALGAPILGMTWHYVDEAWQLRFVPIAPLNIGIACKTGEQLRCMIEEVLDQNPIVGSRDIRVHTGTSDTEASTARAVDLLTNFMGSVRCVVQTLALVVNDVFAEETVWKKYLDHVNKVTTYFNHHQKAAQALAQKQRADGVTADRLQRLRHDIPTRWHSRRAAMSVYLCRMANISSVAADLGKSNDELPSLSEDQQDVLAEFITVLAELRRVTKQLEADRKVTMSRAPRLLRELHETLLIMAGALLPSLSSVPSSNLAVTPLGKEEEGIEVRALPTAPSFAIADGERDTARLVRLRKTHPKALAVQLADRLQTRLGMLLRKVDAEAANWAPSPNEESLPDREMYAARRVLLFHIAAVLDVNECTLGFLDCSEKEKAEYESVLYSAVVREAMEIDGEQNDAARASNLKVVFGLFHEEMRQTFCRRGRGEPQAALLYWKEVNKKPTMISPVPFDTIAKAALSGQASSAPAKRLFSDLGRREGDQAQSLLSSTLEMTELFRVFVGNELMDNRMGQSGLLHPKSQAFWRILETVCAEISKQ